MYPFSHFNACLSSCPRLAGTYILDAHAILTMCLMDQGVSDATHRRADEEQGDDQRQHYANKNDNT